MPLLVNCENFWPRKRAPFQTIEICTLLLTLTSNILSCITIVSELQNYKLDLSSDQNVIKNPISVHIANRVKISLTVILIVSAYFILLDLFGLIISFKVNKKLSLIFVGLNLFSLLMSIVLIVIYDNYSLLDLRKVNWGENSTETISEEQHIRQFQVRSHLRRNVL